MNRPIKFRGYSTEYKKWTYGNYGYDKQLNAHFIFTDDIEVGFEVEEKSVGEFTGLRDGIDNEVYEGDIFEAIYKDCPDGYSILGRETTVIKVAAEVVFKWGKFMVKMMHPQEKQIVHSDLDSFLKNKEKVVLSNIYL